MNDLVHRDVMCLGKCIRNKLLGKTDADLDCVGAGLGEQAVVEPATSAEASAGFVEGKAGTNKGVDLLEGNFGRVGGGFEQIKGAGAEIVAGVESEVVADDFRIDPGEVGAGEDDCGEIHLAGERGIDRDGAQRGVGEQPFLQGGASGGGAGFVLTQPPPHGFAELGFTRS